MCRHHVCLLVLALAGAPGCYLFNGLGGAGSAMDARVGSLDAATGTGPRDASGTDVQWVSPLDASTLVERDVWYADTGPTLPPEPEPDPGPDGRPSDDPGEDWVDPPGIEEEDPCCTLGVPVRLAARPRMAFTSDPPLIAWRPGRWALVVTRQITRGEEVDFGLQVYDLSTDGTPIGDARVLEAPPILGTEIRPVARALRWAAGRWAFAAAGDSTMGTGREIYVRLYDAAFAPATTWLHVGPGMGVDLAYLARGDGWLAFTSYPDVVRTTAFDELSGIVSMRETPIGWSMTLRAASFGSRAAVLPIRAESRPDLLVVDPDGEELGRVSRPVEWIPAGGMAAVRDLAVSARARDGHVETEVFDPFALAQLSEPHVIGDSGSIDDGALDHAVDVAGSSKFGVAGVCWGVPAGPDRGAGESQLRFAIVGPDGVRRGAAVTLVSSHFRTQVGCTVGTDDRGFLVGWWNGSELWVRRVDVAP